MTEAQKITHGEFIDNMTIDEIINHPQFYSLSVVKGFFSTPDYWKVVFESNQQNDNGRWLSLTGQEIFDKLFAYYKLKT